MILYAFFLYAAASIVLNLAIAELTKQDPQKPTKALLKSSFGFSLEKPFGKVKISGCNVFWGRPIKDKKVKSGGFLGIGGQTSYKSYATFAVIGGWGEIEKITKIWLNGELIFDNAEFVQKFPNLGSDSASNLLRKYFKKKRSSEKIEFHLGNQGQQPSSIISEYEGIESTPAFINRFYLVFKKLEITTGSGYPSVDIEVQSKESNLHQALTWACKAEGLRDQEIEIDPALNIHQQVNLTFAQDGGSAKQFIEELQAAYFFFTIDLGYKIIFRDFKTARSLGVVDLSLDNLGAVEGNDTIIDRYKQEVPDFLDLPSQLEYTYVSPQQNYDNSIQIAFRHEAKHHNDTTISTRLSLEHQEANNIAWQYLNILWTQSRRVGQLRLLPSVGKKLELGNLFSIPIDGVKHIFQVEKKENGNNDLIEVTGVAYDITNVNFVNNNPVFLDDPTADIAIGSVIPLDIPLIQDSDEELGIYVFVTSTENWKYGEIFISDNGGDSYSQLANFTGKSTVGTVTQIPQSNNPDIIDYGSEIIIEIPNGGIVESISEADFLNLKQIGLFGSEIITWQNAQSIAPDTYKLTKLIRGLRGTERNINQHAINERFVLLKGTDARLIRVPIILNDIGRTFKFKAVHNSQEVEDLDNETSLTVTGEAIRPYAPVNPEILKDTATNDLTIEWTLRTRRYGQWRDGVDIVYSDTNRSILEILAGNTVVHTAEIFNYENPSYTFTAAQQIDKFGSLQTQLSFNVYQVSSLIGRGYPLQATNIQPSKFV